MVNRMPSHVIWRANPTDGRENLCRSAAIFLQNTHGMRALQIARMLYIHAEKIDKMCLITEPNIIPSHETRVCFEDYIDRASLNEPLSRIIGIKYFYDFPFIVTQDTLDPRSDSEVLIDVLCKMLDDNHIIPSRLLDVGTGTGCLAIILAKKFPKTVVIGLDISEKALIIARENAKRASVHDRCYFVKSDIDGRYPTEFDVVISNPPYIPTMAIEYLESSVRDYDPYIALDGGSDGFDFYRKIACHIPKKCKNGAYVFLEIGIGQAVYVKEILSAAGFIKFGFHTDSHNIIRCVSCILKY